METKKISIFGLNIDNVNNGSLLDIICNSISSGKPVTIGYAGANTLNGTFKNKPLRDKINAFDFIHPDGMGVYLAARYLYGKDNAFNRMTGSDFYPLLTKSAEENKWKVFFFGHDDETLRKVKNNNKNLMISGTQNGYSFESEEVLKSINKSNSDLLIVGLGFPKQEEWLFENKNKLNVKTILLVGDGIKIFAGTKVRGPSLLRAAGLEWLVRFLSSPIRNFKRYVIGNPLFMYRIFRS